MDRSGSPPGCRHCAAVGGAFRTLASFVCEIGPPGWPGVSPPEADVCPVIDWARSGAMWLTGWPSEAPLAFGAGVMPALRAALFAFETLAARVHPVSPPDPAWILGGRAALSGGSRRGRTSIGGSCRLIRARDGWVAVNLARDEDHAHLQAVLGGDWSEGAWPAIERTAAAIDAAELVARGQLVGVPISALPSSSIDHRDSPRPWRSGRHGRPRPIDTAPVVIDLSSLWAGPLCARMLSSVGMRVVKVESTRRPDGARAGSSRFFDWLHHDHESVALDFSSEAGRRALRALLFRADIVIEASRPRALGQLGIDAEAIAGAGATWISITGYGRRGDLTHRVAFGDDAAVAGGLVAWDRRGEPVFCADAIADPLTGVHAAVAGLASMLAGGGHLIELAMSEVAAFSGRIPASTGCEAGDRGGCYQSKVPLEVLPPTVPPLTPRAAGLGRDTRDVLARWA